MSKVGLRVHRPRAAGTEQTVALRNREAFRTLEDRPLASCADVSERDTSVELFGQRLEEARSCSPRSACLEMVDDDGRRRGVGARPGARRGGADDPLEPGVEADGGGSRRASSATPLAGSSSTGARRTTSSRALCRVPRRPAAARIVVNARHHDPGLAQPRSRPRLPPLPARQGNRPVHERTGCSLGCSPSPLPPVLRGAPNPRPEPARPFARWVDRGPRVPRPLSCRALTSGRGARRRGRTLSRRSTRGRR